MPGFVKTPKDEKKWSKAKEASGKETAPESKGYWRLANFIFHKMKKHQELEKFEKLKKDLMGLMRSDPTKVPNPMKAGEQTVTSKMPKALKISNPLDKPSVFFKSESGSHELKHVNMCKLNDFMKKCRK